jgi:hypothetical protein
MDIAKAVPKRPYGQMGGRMIRAILAVLGLIFCTALVLAVYGYTVDMTPARVAAQVNVVLNGQ